MTIGIFVGKFLMLHQGHIHAINTAYTQCDKLYVIVCHSQYDNDKYNYYNIKPTPYQQRVTWLKSIFEEYENITILSHKEDHIMPYPHGWKKWSKSIHKLIEEHIDIYFTSSYEDKDNIEKYFPDTKLGMLDHERKEYPISSTTIMKEGVFKHWKFIPNITKYYYNKKIAIVGTESTGKSTLAKLLATKFNTLWVPEYGRQYIIDNYNGDESRIEKHDYRYIASHHNDIMDLINKFSTNKITIFDTEAITTQYYATLYHDYHDPIVDEIIEKQHFDLFLYLDPDVQWIDDGMRLNPHNRNRNDYILKQLMYEYNISRFNIEHISGTYLERYTKALHFINLLKFKYE